jgi:hypothetical protein
MDFVIGREITDLSYNLKWLSSEKRLVKTQENTGLVLTPELCDQISKLQLCQVPLFPNEEFIRAYKDLTPCPHWPSCLPKAKFLEQINSFALETDRILEEQDMTYFFGPFQQGQKVFDTLSPANIDMEAFLDLCKSNPEDTNLLSFRPVYGSTMTNPICYSRTDSVTGRLTVVKGPQILHLKKKHRRQILAKSRFGSEGKVYEFDYKCLEPRVLLALQKSNQQIPVDIYQHAHEKVFNLDPILNRDKVKIVLLTSLYGGSTEAVSEESTLSPRQASEAVSALGSYFGIESLRERLVEESRQHDYIKNLYGRKVSTLSARNGILVNYFTQSTAMDVAQLGFSKIVKNLDTSKAVPLYLITDALYMDIHNSVEERVVNHVVEVGSRVDMFPGVKFHLEPKVL